MAAEIRDFEIVEQGDGQGAFPENDDWRLWRRAFHIRLTSLEKEMGMNTEATARVESNTAEAVELLKNIKGFVNVVKFVVPFVVMCLSVYAAWPK